MTVLLVAFGFAFTVLAILAFGGIVLKPLARGPTLDAYEFAALRFIVGAAALSLTVFLLGLVGLARWEVFLLLGLLATIVSRRSPGFEPIPSSPLSLSRPATALGAALFLGFGLYYFIHAMKPEASPDGATYHLGLVARFLREGAIVPVRDNLYAGFPKGMEMLNLFAFAFGRHSAAALVHFACLIALAAGIFVFARRAGHPFAGLIAALLFFLSPAVAMNGVTAYNDVALALAGFGAFRLVELGKQPSSHRLLPLAGFVAGFAFAIKYTGAAVVLYVLTAIAVHVYRKRQLAPSFLLACAFAALSAAPYLLHNWIVRGNPLAPFFNRLFPNPYVHISFEDMAREMARFYPGLASYWQLPWEIAIRGGIPQGLLGPVFLLAPLALLSLRSDFGRKVLLAALIFALPFFTNVGTRLLIPALPFLCLALGLVLTRSPRIAAAVVALHAITILPPVQRLYATPGLAMLNGWPVRAALRLQHEEQSLSRLAPAEYDVVRIINRHVPKSSTVLAVAWVMEAYTSAHIRTHHLSAANERLTDILWTPLTPGLQPLKRFSFSFPRRDLRAIRIVQTSRAAPMSVARRDPGFILNRPRIQPDQWGMAELHLQPARPLSSTSAPNPWDSALALDGNPVTVWKTWQPAEPGMFFEVSFDRPRPLHQVSFDSPLAQSPLAFRLLGKDLGGNWTELADNAQESRLSPPPGMTQHAGATLQKEGIDFLLVDPSVWGADTLYRDQAAWGLCFLEQSLSGVRLYRLCAGQPPLSSQRKALAATAR